MVLTTCGHVKTFSTVIVSTDGSSNAHCFANGIIADTAKNGSPTESNGETRRKNQKQHLHLATHLCSFRCVCPTPTKFKVHVYYTALST